MPTRDLVCVAAIRGAFGVRGEIRIQSYTETPEDCFGYGPLLDEAGHIILTVKSHRKLKKGYAAKAEEVSTPEQADALKNIELHVPRSALPVPEEDEFYVRDLEGLRAIDRDGNVLGRVIRAPDYGAGVLLEIKPDKGASFLVPFSRDYVPEVDLDKGVLRVNPPETEPDED